MNCPYCKSSIRQEWEFCKGCGWTTPQRNVSNGSADAYSTDEWRSAYEKTTKTSVTHPGVTAKEATETMRAAFGVPHPGISTREFDHKFRSSTEYKASFYGQRERLDNEIERLKVEIGRAFPPLFRPLLKLFF